MPIVEVEHLLKEFGTVRAVDDVSFHVEEGEFFALLGPSGCGKSTTLRCLAGLEQPTGGRVTIAGQVVNDPAGNVAVPPERRGIGMVFQNYAVWPHMTVAQNVAYPLKMARRSAGEQARRVQAALQLVRLGGLEQRYPSQLSGGQQQRVAVARAIVMEPAVMLLDEPLSNLDAKLREQTRFELKELQRRLGIAIVYVTHDQSEALALADRVAIMSDGRLQQVAPPEEVYQNPANAFVADFVGSMNLIPCRAVPTGIGWTAELPGVGALPAAPGPAGAPNGAALLAVRPEHVRLHTAEGEGRLAGRIEVAIFLGSAVEYRVRIGDVDLRVQSDAAQRLPEGAQVHCEFVRARLYPPDPAEVRHGHLSR